MLPGEYIAMKMTGEVVTTPSGLSEWMLWDYMVYDGLRKYGYNDLAHQLAGKMVNCVTVQLSKNHNYWESYSPDNESLNCPPNYIWDSIIAKLLIDENQK